jgi:DNA polymerase-4
MIEGDTDRRTVVHMDLDTFFVSVERLRNSELNNKPVIIGGLGDRGVVASCSYEARKYGVHSAMPMKMARNLCNDATIIRGDMDSYSKYSRLVTDVIAEEAPLYEKASIDEHYLDISGMDRFFGSWKWSQELRRRIIRETGLPISFGLSINKTVSKIATGEAKPDGELHVPRPGVQTFLNPLSIRKIPMVGGKTYQTLRTMGVTTIEVLSQIPMDMMGQVMGKNGVAIWKKAHGVDHTPVVPYHERKSISHETTFEKDSIDVIHMKEKLVRMVEKLAYELRKKEKLAGTITVKIRYSNFDTHTQQKQIPYTSFDHVLIHEAKELFDKLYTRRMLIRLIGVKVSNMVSGVQQINMFEDTPEMINLYQAMDNIRNRFGNGAVRRAVGMKRQV